MIGIIGAMTEEVELLKEGINVDDVITMCGMDFYLGIVNDVEVVLTKCGVGKVNAAMATTIMINHFECDLIINTGIAGGINGVSTKDIVIGNKLMYHDMDCTIFGYDNGQVPGLPTYFMPDLNVVISFKKALNKLGYKYKETIIYSGDSFVSSLEQLKNVDVNISCIAEMEGAAIAHVCVKSGVSFIVLRYISDVVGAENQVDDYLSFETEMARRSATICLEVLKNIA